ncbi:MAG: hypothetical protein QXU18_08730 [Thermoplasmatales archaeon]
MKVIQMIVLAGAILPDKKELEGWIERKRKAGYVVLHKRGSDSATIVGKLEEK